MSKAARVNRLSLKAKRLARTLGLKVRWTIVIDVLDFTKLRHLEGIIDRLQGDNRLKIVVVAPIPLLKEHFGMGVHCYSQEEFAKKRLLAAEAFLSTDFHRKPWWLATSSYIYVTHGTSPKLNYATSNLTQCDVIMTPGDVIDKAQRNGAPPTTHVYKVGLPVTDKLFELRNKSQRMGRPRCLLYAPTWNSDPLERSISESLLQELASLEGFKILIRPHPKLLVPDVCEGKDWRKIINSIENENLRLIDSPKVSTYDLMAESDVLLGDVSSVVYEYTILDRPILLESSEYFFKNNNCESERTVLESAATVRDKETGLQENLLRAIRENPGKTAARNELIARYFYNLGSATDAATKCLYQAIGLDPL